MSETSDRDRVFFKIKLQLIIQLLENHPVVPIQCNRRNLKLTTGLIHFRTFADRVVPLKVFQMI